MNSHLTLFSGPLGLVSHNREEEEEEEELEGEGGRAHVRCA